MLEAVGSVERRSADTKKVRSSSYWSSEINRSHRSDGISGINRNTRSNRRIESVKVVGTVEQIGQTGRRSFIYLFTFDLIILYLLFVELFFSFIYYFLNYFCHLFIYFFLNCFCYFFLYINFCSLCRIWFATLNTGILQFLLNQHPKSIDVPKYLLSSIIYSFINEALRKAGFHLKSRTPSPFSGYLITIFNWGENLLPDLWRILNSICTTSLTPHNRTHMNTIQYKLKNGKRMKRRRADRLEID